jgi:hypothetical protein
LKPKLQCTEQNSSVLVPEQFEVFTPGPKGKFFSHGKPSHEGEFPSKSGAEQFWTIAAPVNPMLQRAKQF